jgi:hypothetical protein
MLRARALPVALALAALPAAGPALASEADREIAKVGQLPAPYAARIRLTDEVNFGLGLRDRTGVLTTLDGAIPFTIPWTPALLHLQLPLVWQPVDFAVRGGQYGMGDFEARLYVVPGAQERVTWGIGPAIRLPTATDSTIGQHKWSAGLGGAIGVAAGPWVLSLEAQQLWSLLGPRSRPEVDELQLRPQVVFHLPGNWFLVTAPVIVANWDRKSADRWTVPIGGGFGRIFSISTQRLTLGLEVYAPVVHPTATGGSYADWTIRAQVGLPIPVK